MVKFFFMLLMFILGVLPYQFKGITFTNGKYCPNVTFSEQDAQYSLKELSLTGADSVAIVISWFQENITSTTIFPQYNALETEYYTFLTETDQQVISIINQAHKYKLKVLVKLQIDLINDDGEYWRGDIGIFYNEYQWDQWFDSYTRVLMHYAEMSEVLNVYAFSVSCELIQVSKQEVRWRELIQKIRNVYKGQITSSANWGWLDQRGGEDTNKKWWDIMDFIGIDAYYNINQNLDNPTLQQLIEGWTPVIERFQNLSSQWNKKIVLTEIGYCSGQCSRTYLPTNDDLNKQGLYYQAAFEVLKNKEWFDGMFWWSWNSDPRNGGDQDNCITPQHKQAEEILRKYYGGIMRIPKLSGPAKCLCTV